MRFLPLAALSLLAACAPAASGPQAIEADATLTDGGTTCPEANWLAVEDYSDPALPADTDDFLGVNGARSDVTTTDSGLQYRVVQRGLSDGATPELGQRTRVHYHGYFPGGEVFDSSYERGETIAFKPSQVIAGWTEALTGMQVCEARTLYVPGDLAYGQMGSRGIPPNATLLFNVQVLGVE